MKILETDVAVISAALQGWATVAAAERGVKVIAFEKGSTTGGTANMGMGPFAVESRLQKIKTSLLLRKKPSNFYGLYSLACRCSSGIGIYKQVG